MRLHPRRLPNLILARHFFFAVRRRLKQEKLDRFFNQGAIATKAERCASHRRDKNKAFESGLFFNLAHGRLRQRFAQFLMPFRKRPAPIRVFDEKNLNVSAAMAKNHPSGGYLVPETQLGSPVRSILTVTSMRMG